MQTHIRVFCSGSQFGRRPAKVDPVVRNKIPVAFEDDALEFQVLRARLSEVIHMRANNSPRLGGAAAIKWLRFSSIVARNGGAGRDRTDA